MHFVNCEIKIDLNLHSLPLILKPAGRQGWNEDFFDSPFSPDSYREGKKLRKSVQNVQRGRNIKT